MIVRMLFHIFNISFINNRNKFKKKQLLKGKQLICFVDHTKYKKKKMFREKKLTSSVIVLNHNDMGHPWVIKAAWSPRLLLQCDEG